MDRSHVLIVGAGPAGLAAALALAHRGVDLRIVDPDPDPGPSPESRAIAVNPRTLELLEPLGATERLVAAGLRLNGLRVASQGARAAELDLRSIGHRFNFMLSLPQSRTEEILAACLAERGRSVERGVAAAGFTEKPSGIETVLATPDGERRVASEWLIGADGAHSTVRKALGIGFPGEAYPFEWNLADVDLAPDVPLDWAEIRLDLGRPVLARFPIPPNRHRLISNGAGLLKRVPREWGLGRVHWQSSFKVSRRQAESLGRGKIWLIGDAAHIHSPVGGRGMNLGIEDGVILAERIAAGDIGDWPEKRHAKAAAVIKQTDGLQRLATADGFWGRRVIPRLIGLALRVPAFRRSAARSIAGLED